MAVSAVGSRHVAIRDFFLRRKVVHNCWRWRIQQPDGLLQGVNRGAAKHCGSRFLHVRLRTWRLPVALGRCYE